MCTCYCVCMNTNPFAALSLFSRGVPVWTERRGGREKVHSVVLGSTGPSQTCMGISRAKKDCFGADARNTKGARLHTGRKRTRLARKEWETKRKTDQGNRRKARRDARWLGRRAAGTMISKLKPDRATLCILDTRAYVCCRVLPISSLLQKDRIRSFCSGLSHNTQLCICSLTFT